MARFILLALVIVNSAAPMRAQNPPPAASSGPVDGSLRANFDGSRLQALLVREGYFFLKLARDKKTLMVSAMCQAEGKPVHLLIDSGTNRTSVSDETAKRLRLKITGSDTIASGGRDLVKVQTASIHALEIGRLGSVEAAVFVVDDASGRALAKENGQQVYDGILGSEWLAAHSCVLDLGNNILYYLPPGPNNRSESPGKTSGRARTGALLWQSGFKFLDVRRTNLTRLWIADSTANGKRLHLMVDTGAVVNSVAVEIANELKLAIVPFPGKSSMASGDVRDLKFGPIADWKIGDLDISGSNVWVMDFSAQRKQAQRLNELVHDGILGVAVLSFCSAIIDFGHDVIYYCKNPFEKQFDLLSGKWQARRVEREGVLESAARTKEWKASIDGDHLHLQGDQRVWQCAYSLKLGVPHCLIDLVEKPSSGVQKVNRMFGNYEIDDAGNKLTVCVSTEGDESKRPTQMESKKDSKTILIEFERVTEK